MKRRELRTITLEQQAPNRVAPNKEGEDSILSNSSFKAVAHSEDSVLTLVAMTILLTNIA